MITGQKLIDLYAINETKQSHGEEKGKETLQRGCVSLRFLHLPEQTYPTYALHKALYHPPNKYLLNTYAICHASCSP